MRIDEIRPGDLFSFRLGGVLGVTVHLCLWVVVTDELGHRDVGALTVPGGKLCRTVYNADVSGIHLVARC